MLAGLLSKAQLPHTFAFGAFAALVLLLSLLYLRNSSAGSSKPAASGKPHANGVASPAATDTRPRCKIMFGTQTGTAEKFAKTLRSQLESRYGSSAAFEVMDIENYDGPGKLAEEHLVIFITATYGDGEPTDSATNFYNWLLKTAEEEDAPFKVQRSNLQQALSLG